MAAMDSSLLTITLYSSDITTTVYNFTNNVPIAPHTVEPG